MLTEQRRLQLDEIVKKMVQNNEDENTIKFVVDDFKKKYEGEQSTQPVKSETGILNTVKGFGEGILKQGSQTLLGGAELTAKAFGDEKAVKNIQSAKSLFKTEGTAQKAGGVLEQIIELAVPLSKVKSASLLKKVALEGGIAGTQQAISSGSIDKKTAGTVATGGALSVAGKALSPIAKTITDILPQRLINSAIGQSKKALQSGQGVADYIIKNKKIGTAESLIKGSISEIEKIGTDIQGKLASVKGEIINKDNIVNNIANNINKEGGLISKDEIIGALNTLAPQAKGLLLKSNLTLSEANKLRQALDKTLGDRGFLTSQLPFNKELLREFTNGLRESVKRSAPEGTRTLFDTLSKEIRLRDSLLNKYAGQSRNQIISWGDLFGGGLGFALGGGPAGAITGAAIKRTAESTLFKTGVGVSLGQLKKLQDTFSGLAPEVKATLIELLKQ